LVYNGFSSKNNLSNSGSNAYPSANPIAPNYQHSPRKQNSYTPSVNPQSPGATSILGFILRGFC